MFSKFFIFFLAGFLIISSQLAGVFADNELEKIVLLHTNDEHGEIENFGRIAWKKQKLEGKYDEVFLLSAGDIFSGNPLVDHYTRETGEKFPGKPMIELMNAAGYDAMVIGNHDFDYGQEQLNLLRQKADFPMILANIEIKEKALLEKTVPYLVEKTGRGTEISFLGLVEVGSGGIPATHPSNLAGLVFSPPVKVARQYGFLARESDIVIGLTHLGLEKDIILAKEIEFLDAILGGHSHTALEKPEEVNGTLIAQAGSGTRYLGKIIIKFNTSEGKVKKKKGTLLPIDEIKKTNSSVEEKITAFQEEMAYLREEVIAFYPGGIRGREQLGSLLARAVAERYDLDIAFQNIGGVRTGYLPPKISPEDIYRLDPFANEIVIVEMTIEELRDLLANSFSRRNSIDLLPGGGSYEVRVNEAGQVEKINIWNMEGKKFSEGETYLIGLNSYVAETYYPLPQKREKQPETTAETLIGYLKKKDEVKLPEDDKTAIKIDRAGAKGMVIAHCPLPLSTDKKNQQSVSAGTLIAEALRVIGRSDLGFFPAEQLYPNLELTEGPLNREILDLFFPGFRYENPVLIIELAGETLEKIMVNEVKRTGYVVPYQFSKNLEYVLLHTEDDERDIELFLEGKRIEKEKTYSVAINRYEASKWQQRYGPIKNKRKAGYSEKEALLAYLDHIGILSRELWTERVEKEKPR